MARMRKFCAYRRVERPYTRISKYRKLSYVRARPNCRIVRYNMGDLKSKFDTSVILKSKVAMQVRDNALEAARQTMNRYIQKKLGKIGWRITIRCFPHHILRENPLAAGAGADRMSTGMKRSFGKTIGVAAQIREGQIVFQIETDKHNIAIAKDALKRGSAKLPFTTSTVVETKKAVKLAPKTEVKEEPEAVADDSVEEKAPSAEVAN